MKKYSMMAIGLSVTGILAISASGLTNLLQQDEIQATRMTGSIWVGSISPNPVAPGNTTELTVNIDTWDEGDTLQLTYAPNDKLVNPPTSLRITTGTVRVNLTAKTGVSGNVTIRASANGDYDEDVLSISN